MNEGLEEDPFLPGALARRLVHDLAGPLAALVTIAELSPEIDPLILQAIAELRARLSLARLLYGGQPDAAFDRAQGLELVTAQLLARRHRLQAHLPESPRAARGLLLLALAASDMMTGPGEVLLQPHGIAASGRHRELDSKVQAALATGATAEPGLVPAACAAALLGPVLVCTSDTGLVFSVGRF